MAEVDQGWGVRLVLSVLGVVLLVLGLVLAPMAVLLLPFMLIPFALYLFAVRSLVVSWLAGLVLVGMVVSAWATLYGSRSSTAGLAIFGPLFYNQFVAGVAVLIDRGPGWVRRWRLRRADEGRVGV